LIQSWFVRKGDLTPVSQSCVSQSYANTGLSIGVGYFGFGSLGLFCGALASSWVGMGMMFSKAQGFTEGLTKLSFRRLISCLKRFGGEALLSPLASILNTTSLSLLPLILLQNYSTAQVGCFSLMHRFGIGPVGLITRAIGQSFWVEAARLKKENPAKLKSLYLKTTRKLAMFSIPVGCICLAGPFFVGPVLGSKNWDEAGFILAALTPMIIGTIVFSPLSHLIVHRKQIWQVLWDVCRVFAIALISLVCVFFHAKISTTVLFVSLGIFFLYTLLYFMNILCFRGEE